MTSMLVTGATGLVGLGVIDRLLDTRDDIRVHALVRSSAGAAVLAARLGSRAARVSCVTGDVTRPGLGLDRSARRHLRDEVSVVIHAAADTTFSLPLEDARRVNTAGTANVLELVAGTALDRFIHVSTAYVAGMRTGEIAEAAHEDDAGFVNGYEQSKHEAEQLVRESGEPFVILRPSSIVCDDATGGVSQYNAVHRALRVFHAGLGCLMPGAEDTPVDAVTNERVVDGIVHALTSAGALGGSWHLCAGTGAMPLGEMLDRAHNVWSRDTEWRRRGILRPALTDLATYRLFEESVDETGDVRLAMITRSLSHFVPQLALPKVFVTTGADALLGGPAPRVADYWERMIERLLATRWGAARSAA
jgi:nucleoside-diphosphate-sugar epimerase